MAKVKTFKEVEKEVEKFLSTNYRLVFEELLGCIMDVGKSLEIRTKSTGLSDLFLYESGLAIGAKEYQRLNEVLKLDKKSLKEITYYTDALFSRLGIGEIEFIKKVGQRILRFKKGTFFAKREGFTGKRVCHWVAGFIAGATRQITGGEFEVEEVACVSKGDEHCDFMVRPKLYP